MILFYLLLLLSISTDARYFKCNRNFPCGCGSEDVEMNARIISGEEAIPFSWSMVVSIRYNFFHDGDYTRHACGGTIVSDSYILTAVSCLEELRDDMKSANVTIATAIHRRSQPLQIVRHVDQMIVHPNWTSARSNDYDIALLHLSEPLHIHVNSLIARTCFSPQFNRSEELMPYPPSNTILAVVGWGRTSSFGYDSDILRQTIVSSIDRNDTKCANQTMNPMRQLCTGLFIDSTGPCYGDFGGPIFQWTNDHWEQIGIASSTSNLCIHGSTVVYTRLAYYHDWIQEQINETSHEITTTATLATTQLPAEIYECDRYSVPCGCGRRNVRISHLDNYEAIPYSWSMIVSIRLNHQNKHSCSGTILSESYILTSASCLVNASLFGVTIVAGIHNHSEDNAILRKVDQIFFHPNYTGPIDNYANDIAILHISEALNFDTSLFISQICLPHRREFLPESIFYPGPGARLIVTGWGLMNCENKTEQQLLQQMKVYSVSNTNKNCYILDKHRQIQFCAGLADGDAVPCIRDSGRPIFQWLGDRWDQVGIASYGIDYAPFKDLEIYTRIIDYNNWIESITKSFPASITPLTSTNTATSIVAANSTTKPVKLPKLYRCNHTLTCGCGAVPVVSTPARIVGGENAVDYSWPMVAALRWPHEDNHQCGGAVLSNSYILTAAHCLDGYETNPPKYLTVSVGLTNQADVRQIRRTADRIDIHPNYTGTGESVGFDIALVHISPPLTMGNNLFVTKTCIHPLNPTITNEQYIKNGTPLMTIGWGRMGDLEPQYPKVLQQVEVYAIANDDPICTAAEMNPETEFCAGLHEGGKDSCQGDSGGPIFQWAGDHWEQVGVVSRGEGCAEPGKPGIYTRLSYYYDWMNEILKNDSEHLEPNFSFEELSTKPTLSTVNFNFSAATTTMLTNESNATRPNNANNNHRKNALLFSALALFSGIILQ